MNDAWSREPSGSKKCPECLTLLPASAKVCTGCQRKVGPVNRYGMARRPVDWKGYTICLLAWAALGIYIWWAFF